MKKIVFVTGASGFIGRHVISQLVREGYIVRAVIRREHYASEMRALGAEPVFLSLRDGAALRKALEDVHVICHLASMLNVWGASWDAFHEVNVETTKRVLRSAPKTLEKFVYVSTVHVHGVHHGMQPVHEESPYSPSTSYAKSKCEAEEIVRGSGTPFVIVRPSMVYGPGDRKGFLLNLLRLLEKRDTIAIPGDGTNTVHLVHINDVVEGITRIVASEKSIGKTYILAGAEPITVNNLIALLGKQLGKTVRIRHVPLSIARVLSMFLKPFGAMTGREPLLTKDRLDIATGNRSFSIENAKHDLGYCPRIGYEDGVQSVVCAAYPFLDADLIRRKADEHGTPHFLFSESILRRQYKTIKNSFSGDHGEVRIYYSAKTNFTHAILQSLKRFGSGLEIACGQELKAALRAGFTPEEICFDGPVKTDEDIEYAVKEGIAYFNFDSLTDAENVSRIAKRLGKTVRGGFRVSLGIKGIIQGPAEIYVKKFGVPLRDVVDAYEKARTFPNIRLECISSHIGSQIITIKPYREAVRSLVDTAVKLEDRGFTIREVNIGGGYPSASLTKTTLIRFALSIFKIRFRDKVPALSQYGEAISREFSNAIRKMKTKPVLAIEPGRSVVSPAGILISRIKVLKDGWAFVDGSKYFVPESAFFAEHSIAVISRRDGALRKQRSYRLAGSSLNTADIFASSALLPELEPGDIVIVGDAGAYSISRAIPFTVLLPPVYLLDDTGATRRIRREGRYDDVLSSDILD